MLRCMGIHDFGANLAQLGFLTSLSVVVIIIQHPASLIQQTANTDTDK